MSKMRVAAVAVLTVSMLGGGVAAAEGYWDSTLEGVLQGFTSRGWTDRDSDGASTKIRLAGCRLDSPHALSKVTVQLTYNNTWTPDENLGWRKLACSSSGTGNYGRVKAGNHHFSLIYFNGTQRFIGRLSASDVNVSY